MFITALFVVKCVLWDLSIAVKQTYLLKLIKSECFSQENNASHISLETENTLTMKKKGNMRVNESLRQREQGGGGAGKEDLGDAEVGRV